MAVRTGLVVVCYLPAARLSFEDLPRRHGRGHARRECPLRPPPQPTDGASPPPRRFTVFHKRSYRGPPPPPAAASASARTALHGRRVLLAKRLAAARLAAAATATLASEVDTALAAGSSPSASSLAARATACLAPLPLRAGGCVGSGAVLGLENGTSGGAPSPGVKPPPPVSAHALTHADSLVALG